METEKERRERKRERKREREREQKKKLKKGNLFLISYLSYCCLLPPFLLKSCCMKAFLNLIYFYYY
jgi:hypothetical protein